MSHPSHNVEQPGALGPVTRRSFLRLGALLTGAGAAAAGGLFSPFTPDVAASTAPLPGDPLDDDPRVRMVHTTCQQCHSRCGLKCKVWNGTLIKIDGNPFNPTNTEVLDGTHAESIPYATDPSLASTKIRRGRICGKSQDALETLYNPLRLRTPLKRVGPRGEGRWESISWSQAISEIVNGGTIDNGGGTSYSFTGLKALRSNDTWIGGTAYHGADKKTGTAASGTASTLVDAVGGLAVNAFAGMDLVLTGGTGAGQTRRILSNTATDYVVASAWGTTPDATTLFAVRAGDLGRSSNMVMFSPGRQPVGNSNFSDRVWRDAFGTVNARLDHTSICETSHHVGTNLQTTDSRMAQTGKNAVAPDLSNAEYVVFFGENPAEAGFPHQSFARKLVDALHRQPNPLKAAVVDPRFSRSAEIVRQNGGLWVPAKPGTDAAVALGMIAWMLESVLNDGNPTHALVKYLKLLNRKSAADTGIDPNFSDACYLVVRTSTDATIKAGEFLDAAKLTSGAGASKDYVAVIGGAVTAVDPDSASQTLAAGTLDVDGLAVTTTGGGVVCDSVYGLLRKQAFAGKASATQAVAHWAGIAGVPAASITQMGQDFVAAGRRASSSHYRGAVQHTNGTYNSMAINALNWLVGSLDAKGGGQVGASYSETTSERPGFNGAKTVPLGPRIDRATKNHTDVPNFFALGPDAGRTPTRRAWFPFAQNGNFQETVPSMGGQYPYPCKAYFSCWNVWPYSTPGGKSVARAVLLDTARVPLHVAIDVQMGELSAMADYVLPEVTYLETYATPKIPHSLQKEGTTRIPAVGRYLTASGYKDVSEVTDFSTIQTGTEATAVWGATPYYVPILPETRTHMDMLLHIMIGPEGIAPGNDAAASSSDPTKLGGLGLNAFGAGKHLLTAWDFFKELFLNYRSASPALTVDTPNGGGSAMARMSNMLLRGGRFDEGDGTSGSFMANKFGSLTAPRIVHFYVEEFTKKVNSQTGQKDWLGIPNYQPVQDSRGNAIPDDPATYPFTLITFKVSWHGQGRTAVNPALMSLAPENSVWINAADAGSRSIGLGDRVRVTSASDSIGFVTRAFVTQGIAPGVVGVSHHFGHWELGSRPHIVSGVATLHDRRRGAGVTPNPTMRLDPAFGDVSLQDLIGGSVSFSDTRVKIEKA